MSSAELTIGRIGTTSQEARSLAPHSGDQVGNDRPPRVPDLLCLWVLLPLAWVLLLSVKSLPDGTQPYIWPQSSPSRSLLTTASSSRRPTRPVAFKNSVLVTSLTVMASTVTAVLGGYALVHLKTPFRAVITGLLVASLFFPTRVTALLGSTTCKRARADQCHLESHAAVYGANGGDLGLHHAGRLRDGAEGVGRFGPGRRANSLRILGGIMLPLVRNGIVVVIIVNFVAAWGEYLLALTLMNDAAKRTLPVFIANSSGGVGAFLWPRIAALYIIAILPALITFAIAQRWFMKGLQEGALKA